MDDGSRNLLKKKGRKKKRRDSDDDNDEEEIRRPKPRKIKDKLGTELVKKRKGRPRKINNDLEADNGTYNKTVSDVESNLTSSELESKHFSGSCSENENKTVYGSESEGKSKLGSDSEAKTDTDDNSKLLSKPPHERFLEQYVTFVKRRGRPPGSKNKVKKDKDPNGEEKVKVRRKRKPKEPKQSDDLQQNSNFIAPNRVGEFNHNNFPGSSNNYSFRVPTPEVNNRKFSPPSEDHSYSSYPQGQSYISPYPHQSQPQPYPGHPFPHQTPQYMIHQESNMHQVRSQQNHMIPSPMQNHSQMQSVSPIHNPSFVQSQNLNRYAMQGEVHSQPMLSPVQNQNQFQSMVRSPIQNQSQAQNYSVNCSPIQSMAQMSSMIRSPVQNQMQIPSPTQMSHTMRSPIQNQLQSPSPTHPSNMIRSPIQNQLQSPSPTQTPNGMIKSPAQNQMQSPPPTQVISPISHTQSINGSPPQTQSYQVQKQSLNQSPVHNNIPQMPELKMTQTPGQSHTSQIHIQMPSLSHSQVNTQYQSSVQVQSPQSQASSPQTITIVNMNQNHITYKKPLLISVSGRNTPGKGNSPLHSPVILRSLNTPNGSPQSDGSSPQHTRNKVQTTVISNVSTLLRAGKPLQVHSVNPQQRVIRLKVPNNSLNSPLNRESDDSDILSLNRTLSAESTNGFYSQGEVETQIQVQSESDRQIFNMDHGTVISETSSCRVETVQSLPVDMGRYDGGDQLQCPRLPKLQNYQASRSDAEGENSSWQNIKNSPKCEYYC